MTYDVDADLEARLAEVRKVLSRARTHVGSARTSYNEAVKEKKFEDDVDRTQTLSYLALAEGVVAGVSLLMMAMEQE